MSDSSTPSENFFTGDPTTTIGSHEMYPVPVTRETRENNPDARHDELVAGKCEDCSMRVEGFHRGFDAVVRERSCPPPSLDEMVSDATEVNDDE